MAHPPLPTFLNLNVRGLQPSATLAINELSNELIRKGREVFKLGFGQSPFPVPEVVVESLKKNAFQKDYLPVKGLPELREAVAAYNRRSQLIDSETEDILIGPGSKELMFLLQMTYYGDLVIPTPSWVSYSPQARIIGRQVEWVKTTPDHDWRLTPEELHLICDKDPDRPRLVVLNYPANPTGATYTQGQLQEIAEVARQYQLVLLSDEIYGELHHDGQHHSIARYYPEGTIISSGLSKWCGAGGWRLGTFSFPRGLRRLLNGMAVCASETFTSTSAPIQYAAVTAFTESPELTDYLRRSRAILKAVGSYVYQQLTENGISMPRPRGGFYLFPNFDLFRERLNRRGIFNSQEFCTRLLEEAGVALLPGRDFGRPDTEFTARLSYVHFDGRQVLHAAAAMGSDPPGAAFVEEHCQPMVTATSRLIEWCKKSP